MSIFGKKEEDRGGGIGNSGQEGTNRDFMAILEKGIKDGDGVKMRIWVVWSF